MADSMPSNRNFQSTTLSTLNTTHETTGQVSTSESMIELSTLDHGADQSEAAGPEAGTVVHEALPPADGGKDAYLVLAAAFILEGLVWGFPFAFGVFQDYYTTTPQFAHSPSISAAIGTTATGVMYLAAPLMYPLFTRLPTYRKPLSILGFAILTSALIAASFATTIPQLLATQGVLYGIGGCIHYYPVFLYLDEWWVARKGFAYGVVWAGGSASGVAIPLIMQWLLSSYGFRTALRTWAVAQFALTLPAMFWLKGRLPEQHASTGRRKVDLGFLRSRAFWVLQTGNVLCSLGFYMPSLYLPSFARAVGFSALLGTIAVSIMNASNIIGSTAAGILTDKFHVTTAINVCAVGTVLAVFLFWTFAVYTPMLFLFAILYGMFAGGFAATWTGVTDPVRKEFPATDTGMIVSMFAAGKGIGSIVSGPLSGALIRSDVWKNSAAYAFGSGYGYLIVFSGVTASMSFLGWGGKKCGLV